MKSRILALAAVLAMAASGTALAAGDGYSDPAPQNAQCGTAAGSGAFGAFSDPAAHFTEGQPPDFGDDTLGADGYQTGLNNSTICGNR